MISALGGCIYCHFLTIAINYESSQSMTVYDSLHSLMDYESLPFRRDWFGSDLRVGHFFSFRCPLVNTPQLHTQPLNSLTTESLNSLTNQWMVQSQSQSQSQSYFTTDGLRQPVLLGDKPGEIHDQHFFLLNTFFHSPYVTSSRTRGWICDLQLLLILASAVILRSDSRGISWSYFTVSNSRLPRPGGPGARIYHPGTGWPSYTSRRLLRLTELRWICSTPLSSRV
jgi:hypothetical protein